jgi:DNA primase
MLYGLHKAAATIRDDGTAVIVEGYMDAIALYQAGVTNVVASLGTALTQSHARRAKRYTEESVFVFDGDEAGARAVERGAPHFVREGMRTQVVVLPEGSDPDSFVREHGADAFHALVGNAAPLIQYQIERSAHGLQASTSDDKVAAIRQLADLIRIVPSPIYREQYADKIAADFGLARDVVRGELRRYRVSLSRTNTNENVSSQTPGQSADPVAAAEQRLLAYLLEHPTHVAKVADQIPPTNFTAPLHEELARVLYDSARRGETRDGRALLDACADEDLRGLIGLLLVRTLPETHVEEEIQGCVDLLLDRSLRGAELDKLAAAAEGDLEIARELSAMARERRHLTASSRTAGAFGARQRVPTLEGTIDQ